MKTVTDLYNRMAFCTKDEIIEYIKKVYVPRREDGKTDLKRDLHKIKIINHFVKAGCILLIIFGVIGVTGGAISLVNLLKII